MARTTFTTITPLPPNVPRQVVIDFLHDHLEMIDLNPLIKERHAISPPPNSPPEEHRCVWYSLTDRIDYLPGGVVSGQVSYTCAFNDLPDGLQTHCYAPMGLDIRDRWSVGGSLPGEPVEPVELGLNAPLSGLYLREDVDLRCNMLMAAFVKKTLKKAHGSVVDRLAAKAQIVSTNQSRQSVAMSAPSALQSPSILPSPTPASIRSDSSGVPSMGPLLPPSTGNHQGLVPGLATPPPTLAPYGNSSAPYLVAPPETNGSLDLPDDFPGATSQQGGLRHSGTVYRGTSKPHDYDEFPSMNPYEKIDSSREENPAPELNGAYPAPLKVQHDRRARPAELQ
ncbi:hypothetical protein EDB80DRAFT_564449 [Ilyonectria destructans]|nr:hypothetical protein EDB80DRAFT_564449 [Ilyonectria destructans]